MRPEDEALKEVIDIIFHQTPPASGEPLFSQRKVHQPSKTGNLPVPLGSKANPFGHQHLCGQARQRLQAMRLFERGRKAGSPGLLEQIFIARYNLA